MGISDTLPPDFAQDFGAAMTQTNKGTLGGRVMSSLAVRLMGKRWPWIMEMHLFYFSRADLEIMIQNAGLRWIESSPYPHNVSVRDLFKKLGHLSPPGIFHLVSVIALLVPGKIIVPVSLDDVRFHATPRKQAVARAAEPVTQ